MNENKIIENIIEKSQMKIAVSEFKEEENTMPKMNKITKIIDAPLRYFCILLILIYKNTLSKITPSTCIYQPTCSTYTLIAIKRFGSIKGCFIGLKRILRCTPKHKGGLDTVPDCIDDVKFKI